MARDDDWMEEARCWVEQHDQDLFFPRDRSAKGARAAKAICRGCPVRRPCFMFAIAHRITEGVWGGLTPIERGRLDRHKRQQIRDLWFGRQDRQKEEVS